jgi:hypothetical protein
MILHSIIDCLLLLLFNSLKECVIVIQKVLILGEVEFCRFHLRFKITSKAI